MERGWGGVSVRAQSRLTTCLTIKRSFDCRFSGFGIDIVCSGEVFIRVIVIR